MEAGVNLWEEWAAAWWGWVAHSSWQVAVVAVVVWGITRLYRRQSASFRCTLWLLVFLKLLVPPFVAAPWSVGSAAQRAMEAGGYSVWIPAVSQAPNVAVGDDAPAPAAPNGDAVAGSAVALEGSAAPVTFQALLFGVWLVVAMGMSVTVVFQYVRYRRRALRDSAEAPGWLVEMAAAQGARMGLRRAPEVRLTNGAGVPTVFGALRPLVLIPADWIEEFERVPMRDVITHELAHVKRRDLAVGWLVAAITCCYWFHPLVWVAHVQLRREREMACDDWVLRTNETDGKEYAGTILKGAESSSGMVPAGAGFLGLMELSENLLHRIRSAGDAARKRRMGVRSVLTLCGVVLVLFPMHCSSTNKRDTETRPEVSSTRGAATAAVLSTTVAAPSEAPEGREEELALYSKAGPEVHAFIKHTTESFAQSGLWLDAGARDELTEAEREERVAYIAGVLEGQYGRQQCEALAEAGVLRDARLLPGLIKVAKYHLEDQDYDCRPKWMAVAALGRQGDPSLAPVLIPLVDHGNLNTRMWARGSLVRLTGETFGDDKQAWGAWWNAQGKEPKLAAADLAPWVPPGGESSGGEAAVVRTAPEIVSTTPAIGAADIDPALDRLSVTFDQDMGGGFSWTGGGEQYPETTDRPRWIDKRTCELPVKLAAGRVYRVGINAKSYRNFRGANGVPARDRVIYFATKGADPEALAALTPPKVVSKVVGENRDKLMVTFDKPMGGGGSWTKAGGNFPEVTGRMQWSEDKKTCTLPVKLEPGVTYRVGINSANHINFQSAHGVPSEPEVWEFAVGK